MKLKDIGEFGLIDKLKEKIKGDQSVVYSIGEDAAVIRYTKDTYLLFASDMLIEDVHFKISKEKDIFLKIGHKALACNISDIVAMGGIPKYAVVNLGVAPNLNLNKVFDIFSGLKKIAKKFGVNIVGGDLSKSNKIIIDVSLIGFVKKKDLTLRSTAKSGDIIFVTGPLGGSGSGKHLRFTPRLKEAQFLLRNYKINAMIDISDGLIQDLWQILRTSRKGAILYEELLPVATLAKDIKSALYEGEDFELLFTVDPKTAKKIIRDARIKAYNIGKIVRDRKKFDLIDRKGCRKKLKLSGYRHF